MRAGSSGHTAVSKTGFSRNICRRNVWACFLHVVWHFPMVFPCCLTALYYFQMNFFHFLMLSNGFPMFSNVFQCLPTIFHFFNTFLCFPVVVPCVPMFSHGRLPNKEKQWEAKGKKVQGELKKTKESIWNIRKSEEITWDNRKQQ